MGKIVGFGECVVDFIPHDEQSGAYPVFKACPGGSVANLCVASAKLGMDSEFIGAVGNDYFGRMLQKTLRDYGVAADNMIFTDECGTILAFVHPQENGGREYSFANKPGADKMARFEQVCLESLRQADLLHVSSNAAAFGPTRDTQDALIDQAREMGVAVSYDINYRPGNHDGPQAALTVLRQPLGRADIVKATEEELEMVVGAAGVKGAKQLLDQGAHIVLETKGARGCAYHMADGSGDVPVEDVPTLDTTGAGDAFLGAFLSALLSRGDVKTASEHDVQFAATFANRAATFSVQRYGAIEATPTLAEMGGWPLEEEIR